MSEESTIKLKDVEEVDLWKKVVIAYVSSSNAQQSEGAAYWAVTIVKAFRERSIDARMIKKLTPEVLDEIRRRLEDDDIVD